MLCPSLRMKKNEKNPTIIVKVSGIFSLHKAIRQYVKTINEEVVQK